MDLSAERVVFSLPTQPIWDAMSVIDFMPSLHSEMATKGTGKGGLESQVQEYTGAEK